MKAAVKAAIALTAALLLPVVGRAQTIAPDSAAAYAARAGRTVAALASDAFAGRGYGPADGARKAARYLADRFRALELEPLGDSAGRSYYQHFALPINTFPGPVGILVGRSRAARHTYAVRPGHAVVAAPDCPSVNGGGRVVALDTAWFTLDSAVVAKRLRPHSLRNRILAVRAQDEKRLARLPLAARRWVASARAVVVREPKKLTASLARRQGPQPRFHVLDTAWTRNGTPRRATVYAHARFEPSYPALNVVGRLRGTGPSDSVLVVTAHYDHLGQQGPNVTFYGANDNASGTALLLELARHFRTHRPRHDVLFVAFGAEEAGLVGSEWFAEHPSVPLARIRFLLNLDLEGFGDKGATVVNATLHPRRFRQLDSLNCTRGNLLPTLKQRGRGANSDHFPFSERGVPAFFVYGLGGPGHYHDVLDRPATLDLKSAASLYALLREFLTSLDARP